MSNHALERLSERVPSMDPKAALRLICDKINGGSATCVGIGLSNEQIFEVHLPTGQTVFCPVADGVIKTVLLEGMSATFSDGQRILERSPLEIEVSGGLEIKIVPDGYEIREPGLYRMSMEWYHSASVCEGPSVSSTGLRTIQNISPRAFWKTWAGNPDRYPDRFDNDSLNLGKAVHSLVLGDEVFEDHFIWVPEDAPRRPTTTQVKAFERDGAWSDAAKPGAEFWEVFDKKAAGRILLTPDQHEKITYMAESLADNPQCVELLRSDLIEISMIWRDEETGIWVKSRPDCIPTNGTDFSDLKTFSPKGRDLALSAMRSVTDFGYPMQLALASIGAQELLGLSADRCALVFLQTTKPFECIPIEIDTDTLYWAKVECRAGLNKMAACLESGDWPGLGDHIRRYEYPPTKLQRYSDMQASGELPNI